MLTHKQYELLICIEKKLRQTGISPSFDEMRNTLGLKSKSGIHRLITGLEERGFIRRLPHKARALEVVKLPENSEIGIQNNHQRRPDINEKRYSEIAENVIEGGFSINQTKESDQENLIQLPLYGKIAAGTPIEALRDNSSFIDVPPGMLGKGEYYALEIDGDSMSEAGILDGDTALILRSDTAENGSIVVAMVDDSEVTLKRIRRKGQSIALEPANALYKTRIFGPDQVKVQGKLIGLIRSY